MGETRKDNIFSAVRSAVITRLKNSGVEQRRLRSQNCKVLRRLVGVCQNLEGTGPTMVATARNLGTFHDVRLNDMMIRQHDVWS
jgi:hypothetical protein